MTITPDQADRLKQAATSVPWTVHIDSNDVDEIYIYSDDGNMCIGIDLRGSSFTSHDLNLAAAAPDMAETIAGMEYDYGIQQPRPEPHMAGHLMTSWGYRLSAAKATYAGLTDHGVECHIVRRLVSSPEVIDGE